MAKIDRFEDLSCRKVSNELVKLSYQSTSSGAASKDFDFRSQIRRAAFSTMNNIAEGFGRYSKKEFIRFLEIAVSSCNEVRSMCYGALDLGYFEPSRTNGIQSKAEEVKSLCLGLIRYLSKKS